MRNSFSECCSVLQLCNILLREWALRYLLTLFSSSEASNVVLKLSLSFHFHFSVSLPAPVLSSDKGCSFEAHATFIPTF